MTRRTSKDKNQKNKMTKLDQAFLDGASKSISIRTSEGNKATSVEEALVGTIIKTALGGSTHAQRHLVERIEEANQLKQMEIERDVETGLRIRKLIQVKRIACFENGEDPETVLPHPDDIVVDKETGYSIVGPIDEVELRECKKACNLRDVLLLQDALETRLMSVVQKDSPFATTPAVLVIMLNDHLPERFKYSDAELIFMVMKNSNRSKRELLRDCYQGWSRLSFTVPRGFVFPDVEVLQRKFKVIAGALDFIRKHDKAGKLISVSGIANEMSWLAQQS